MTTGRVQPDKQRQDALVYGLLIALILVTVGLRLCGLAHLPLGLWYDEAYNAMDSLWMLESGSPQVFFWGNNGREPMLHYLAALSMGTLGATPYALRLVSALAAILTIPLVFKWLVTLFDSDPDRRWLALIATAGFSFSFWYLVMSRTGHRTVLLPFFAILTAYLFWRGWRGRSLVHFVWAGVALGLSQYTYLSARLLPVLFVLFGMGWTLLSRRSPARPGEEATLRILLPYRNSLWIGLIVMGLVSLVVFLPLGLFFLKNPAAFLARTGDVFILDQIAQGKTTILGQLLAAIRVFVDGYDPNWRHNLVGQPGFDLLSSVGFWLGLVVACRRIRQPAYLFLLVSLFAMWLPAFMSVPAVYTLRLSGLLPIYYAIMAVGLLTVASWVSKRLTRRPSAAWTRIAVLALVFAVSGGLSTYGYFVRWASQPMVYSQYNGPLADLAEYVSNETRTNDVLLPLPVYMHPTTHFLLHSQFREADTLPSPDIGRPAILLEVPAIYLIPNMVEINDSGSYVWLTRDKTGSGVAVIFQLQHPDDLEALPSAGEPISLLSPHTGEAIAQITPLESVGPVLSRVAEPQDIHPMDYNWDHQTSLIGYQVLPDVVQPGQSPTLNLYWRGLTDQPAEYKTFVHLINSRGEPVGQWDGISLSEEQRWRERKSSPEQHILWVGPQAAPGAYLVRIGLIDPGTGERLPVYTAGGEPLGDHVQLGLFYITKGQTNPRQPQTLVSASLGGQIGLLGYTVLSPSSDVHPSSPLEIRLHWVAEGQVDGDYTAFMQLLSAQGQLTIGQDSQPLAGQYPTSRWRPGEVVVDDFTLNLPADLTPGSWHLVTGMYDLETGQRLVAVDENGTRLPDDAIPLATITVGGK